VDTLNFYRDAIKRIMTELTCLINEQHPSSRSGVDCECVFDDQRGHYLVVKVGWAGSRRVCAATLHLRLRNDKIWIEEDMTEGGVASQLLEVGVRKEDIVLGFCSPRTRRHTEFAAIGT
jgi:hypothetical protein